MIFFTTNLKIAAIQKHKFSILLLIGCLINFYSFGLRDKTKRAVENERSITNVAPVFTNTSYSFSVSEQVVVSSSVGQVAATDADGDALMYSIKKGNTNGAFAINASKGLITVAKLLNHHTQNSYTLTVRVTDTQGLFSEASVSITVIAITTFPTFNNITWSTTATQLITTHEVHGEVVNGKLYIFGGYDPQKHAKNPPQWSPTKRSFVYNPIANKWDTIADLPYLPNGPGFGGVTHEGLTTDGTDVYFAGGYKSNADGTGQVFGTKQVWRYNVASNTYTALPDLPLELATGQLRYLKGKLHYMGGANKARRDTTVHYALDLDSLSAGWKVLAPLLNGTNHPGSAVYEGKIYYLGGSHFQDANSITQKTVEVYDPNTNAWTKVADMTTARDHISSAVIVVGDRILVLGGETSHNIKSKLISAYTPSTDTWAELSALPVTKSAGVAAFLNNNIHYTGGNFSNINYKGVPAKQKVDSFTLINADSDKPLQQLKNGDTLNLAFLPTKNLNIKANTNPPIIGSVLFNLSGTQNKVDTESMAPYALFGDNNNGDYYAWTPFVGNYTLKATPYSASGAAGIQGTALTVSFTVINGASQSVSLSSVADAFVRNGNYANNNYGDSSKLEIKGTTSSGFNRSSYLKFSLNSLNEVSSAKLRLYGSNTTDNVTVNISVYGVENDSWTENGITWNNAPAASTMAINSAGVNATDAYYEWDVTNFVKTQFDGDKTVSFLIKDPANVIKNIEFNSKENALNPPQLVVGYSASKPVVLNALNNLSHRTLYSSLLRAKIYPNPVHNKLNIEVPNNYMGFIELKIVDPLGRIYNLGKVKSAPGADNIGIDISKFSLGKGIYYLQLSTDTGKGEIIKFIIE